INMHDFSVTSYNINDGITDNIFTSKFYKLKNGNLLLGTSESFLSFDPAKFTATPPPADVRIISMHIFEKEIRLDSLIKNKTVLSSPYNENSIRIAFSSLEFWNPGAIKYYYKLEGADKEWMVADITNTAVYNQLKEGEYIFFVKCANRDGIFCKAVTQFKIIITPPFWKTWWFIALILSTAALLIYALGSIREKNIKAIAKEKLKVQQLNAEQYRSKLELEQIINYFSSSLIDKHTVNDVLWDVAKNLIGQLGFVDCMFYIWNNDKTKMIQKAGFGPKDTEEEINKQSFTVLPGQGVVGYVMQTKEAVLIGDTSADDRYRPDDIVRLSEITVPVIYNNELLGILDSEHNEKNFFTPRHLQILSTIATLVANKIKSIEAEHLLQQKHIEIYSINEQLSKAKLEALRSQMNPHFIFNSLNAIQECILTNNVDAAYKYLSQFSKLQRMVLNNSEKELIPLSSEIEMLQLYLSLESLRFSDSFTYNINIAAIADTNEIMIPSLITQPLVENAIWHGLRNKDGDKTLRIIYE
ncbi:MAG: histidine kinase, partial [Ferruginibacter sp.]